MFLSNDECTFAVHTQHTHEMKPDAIEFAVAYIATDAKGNTLAVNECKMNANAVISFVEEHEQHINYDIAYRKTFDPLALNIDEPITPLTKKANELVNGMIQPVTWTLTVQRLDPIKPRGTYRKRREGAVLSTY